MRDTLPERSGRRHPGPEPPSESIKPIVQKIWLSAEQPWGKRLVPILHQGLPFYEWRFERLSARSRRLVRQISAATLDRLLVGARTASPGRGRCGTKPDSLLKTEIPIRTGTWDLTRPGYLAADRVAPCGASLAGDFIWSLTDTDIFTGWTEGRAVWNKGAAGVLSATQDVENGLPFALSGFDCDNGGEFLNHHLWTYLAKRQLTVEFTRSRPYHSDDHAPVEQKNWAWPPPLLGYSRLEDPELVAPIYALYKEIWGPLQNFFLPCLKLKKRWREDSHWRKRYHNPETAYQRLCELGTLAAKPRRQLRDLYKTLDPFELKDDLEKRLKKMLLPATKIRHLHSVP